MATEDTYFFSKERIVLTQNELKVPGLKVFGYQSKIHDITPLQVHYHKSYYEIIVLIEGLLMYYIDGKEYRLSGGDISIVPPDVLHSSNVAGEFYWFQLDVNSPDGLFFLNNNAIANFSSQLDKIEHPIIHMKERYFLSILKKAFSIATNQLNPYILAGHLYTFMNLTVEPLKTSGAKRLTIDIEKSIAYIQDKCNEDISLDDIAIHCGLSVSQFKNKFKHQVGIAPRYYINLTKVERAKALLLQGMPVTEVAMELKFNSSSYFSAVFKKFTNYTPSEFCRNSTL